MKTDCKRLSLLPAFLACAIPAAAGVPPMISYQGRLAQPSGAPVADGVYSMLSSIYAAPTGDAAVIVPYREICVRDSDKPGVHSR